MQSLPHLLFIITILLTTTPSSLLLTTAEKDFFDIVNYLRDDDFRLIRLPTLHPTTIKHQHTDACSTGLYNAFTALAVRDNHSLNDEKIDAANVISLCVQNRNDKKESMAQFSSNNNGALHDSLIDMLRSMHRQRDRLNVRQAAAAGEVIWAAAWDSPANREFFLKGGAIDALTNVIVAPCDGKDVCHVAQMWAIAALATLAKSVCGTESRDCEWEYDYEEKKLILYEDSPMVFDAMAVSDALLKDRRLMGRLNELACRKAVSKKHDVDYPWPTRADAAIGDDDVVQDQEFPTIVPWAVASLMKNLVIHPYGRKAIENAFVCLCSLNNSPDELERDNAFDTLERLGVFDDCPRPYTDRCIDYPDWKDAEGEECEVYEDNYWCVEFGDVTDLEGRVAASQACCACGGGYPEGYVPGRRREEWSASNDLWDRY